MSDQQANLDAAIEELKGAISTELEEIKAIIAEIKPGEPLDLSKLTALKSLVSGMSDAIIPPATPDGFSGSVGFTATGNATVSGKFECRNDSAAQMEVLGAFYQAGSVAASAQAPGGVPLDGRLFATIPGAPVSLAVDNLHQLLKGEQAMIGAAKVAIDAQCAAEGI